MQAWYNGKSMKGSYSDDAGCYRVQTDGHYLWSYRTLIGRTLEGNVKQVLVANAPYNFTVSTAKHITLARRVADVEIHTFTYPEWNTLNNPEMNFQPVSTVKNIIATSQVWKTAKGAAKHTRSGLFVLELTNGYTLAFEQITDAYGKVLSPFR